MEFAEQLLADIGSSTSFLTSRDVEHVALVSSSLETFAEQLQMTRKPSASICMHIYIYIYIYMQVIYTACHLIGIYKDFSRCKGQS